MDVLARCNVHESGRLDGQPMLFAHGFGCDQQMWRLVTPRFEDRYRLVLFDHVGAGGSDLSAYDPDRYASLEGYADDVLEVCRALDLEDVIFVGHSVAAMIGVLAASREPERFAKLVFVGPSPRYIDDTDYVGGFSEADITELLESLESNYLGWSNAMAPVIMGTPDRPELGEELTASFCRTDPEIARQFARVTFLADNRDDLIEGARRRRSSCSPGTTPSPRSPSASTCATPCPTAPSSCSTPRATARTSAHRTRPPPRSPPSSVDTRLDLDRVPCGYLGCTA